MRGWVNGGVSRYVGEGVKEGGVCGRGRVRDCA